MPDWLVELGKASPAAVAVVTVVVLFLRFITRREQALEKAAEAEREHRATMVQECHDVQREGTKALGAINETNRQVVEALKKLNGKN